MKSKFSISWKSSKQRRKQRKYRYNAPLHIKHKFLSSHLSKDLIKKYKKRSLPIRKGDKVKILRGQFRGKEGKVEKIITKKTKVYISGIESIRIDGTKRYYPIHASNLMIMELNLEDKRRKEVLERK
ncbi:MAG: 50S ribosomal protein L24 [archaeon]